MAAAIAARPKGATQIVKENESRRAALATDLDRQTKSLEDLEGQKAEATAQSRHTAARNDAEAAPLIEVAKQFGIDVSDKDRVVRWLSIVLVLCCDPFALAALAAIASRRRQVG